ncbi:hypothetical protein DPEC_G00280940, partial [Dallia pectoralis]
YNVAHTLKAPSIRGRLHSAAANSVKAAAVCPSGSGSPRFIPRTPADGLPVVFACGPVAVSTSLSRSIIPRVTGSIIDATSVDINIGRQAVSLHSQVALLHTFYLGLVPCASESSWSAIRTAIPLIMCK